MARAATQTKEKIMHGARTLLSLYGYDATTIDDIITASGITKGAFYHYFKSKEALCEAAVEQAWTEYREIFASIPESLSAVERLRCILEKITALNSSGEWINCRMILKLMSEPHDESPSLQNQLLEFRNWYHGIYKELIEQCRLEKSISTSMNSSLQADSVVAMLLGVCTLNQMETSVHSPQDISSQIMKMLK